MYDNVQVIIPSLNPDEKLAKTAAGMIEKGFTDIVLVDDGSDEAHRGEFGKIKETFPDNITVLVHEVNKGKGRAMKTAFEYVMKERKDSLGVVTVDGDGQHTPEDAAKCIDAMIEKNAFIIGCRDFSLPQVPLRSRLGNVITRNVFRYVCGIKVSDTQTGLRAVPASLLEYMTQVDGDRYEYETNQLLKIGSDRIAYSEVPIETVYIDDNQTSHFHPLRDSARIYGVILKFAASSVISCIIDIVSFRVILMFIPSIIEQATRGSIAGVLARIISAACNFLINKKVVFGAKGNSAKSAVRYLILALCQLGASLGLVALFTILFKADSDWVKTLIKIIVDTCLFFLSFKIQRNWVFKTEKGNSSKDV
ncbi:MAG: bifunctional glycosyltransferase family 2/GtrA family protein [Lachnospiraceae bacterium]|nr:bifunctional glycosyltransferase family 2/GtrA family protein [Lachnospiraceae bacterium]